MTVCADRAHTLAWLTGAEVDAGQLAARLCSPPVPYPLAGGAMWRGVRTVPPGQVLRLERDGSVRSTTWWHPPESRLPLTEGATGLRDALREAVALRVRPGQVLGADLSGGMDSTSLCFLAAEAGAPLVTVTLQWTAAGNQDAHYARYAADHLPRTESLVFPSADLPACFTGLREHHDPEDEPTAALRDRALQARLEELMRSRGAVHRLTGSGGDHVVMPPGTYIHALLRHDPVTALRHTAGWRALDRWPLRTTARTLLDNRPYARWLAAITAQLREPAARRSVPQGWGEAPRLPAWASDRAADILTGMLRTAALRGQPPLAADRARHGWIQHIQEACAIAGLSEYGSAATGPVTHSPFCDDAVISACLAVQPDQAHNPWSYKPLLATAMTGLVPEHLLRRVTKDHSAEEWYRGLEEHRRDLADWAEDSRLVATGLADEDALRRALHSPTLVTGGTSQLERTLAAEAWLRDHAAHPEPPCLRPPHSEEHPIEPAAH
ncbi:asparagine synthase-related protein [Streptomyces ehimensis]|uniref:asparagine synthase (glutamine-hydrolyzing) n=1 Tax=Streptomyces ehimensis TaxID=68195 RepID=A0ABV9BTZ3_9ACTN